MLSQMLWGDAVYVRDLFELRDYSQAQLLSAAIVLHEAAGTELVNRAKNLTAGAGLFCAGVFRLNSAPMTSSLFEPNAALLERFNGIAELCRVVSREDVTTSTLDSLQGEIGPVDWLKIDVQGGELAVIEGATELLKTVVRHLSWLYLP